MALPQIDFQTFMSYIRYIIPYVRPYAPKPSSYFHNLVPSHSIKDISIIDNMAEEGTFPSLADLVPSLYFFIIFSIARLLFQRFVMEPLGRYWLRIKYQPVSPNASLDNAAKIQLKRKSPLSEEEVAELATNLGLPVDSVHIELWNRKRNNAKTKLLAKFCEAFWRFILYTSFTVIGYYTLFVPEPVPWMMATINHWIGWPMDSVSDAVYLYYIVELGSYFHQLLWCEVARSDSLEMLIHHFVTIVLLITSYMNNYCRVGTTILILHDLADIFLELAKVIHYVEAVTKYTILRYMCDITFGIFAVTFFVTRLYIYPRYVFMSSYNEMTELHGQDWMGFKVYFVLLGSLQILHVFWFYTILVMVYKLIKAGGGIEKDERESDDDIGDDDIPEQSKPSKKSD